MSKRKYIIINTIIAVIGLIAFSFLFISVYFHTLNYGEYWFPKLFIIVPSLLIFIMLVIILIYRKAFKKYEEEKYYNKVKNATISFQCEHIGSDPFEKIIKAIRNSGFKQNAVHLYHKHISGGDEGDDDCYIITLKNTQIDKNFIKTINSEVKEIETSFSKIVYAIILLFELLNDEQLEYVRSLVKESLYSKKEKLHTPILLVDESNGNSYYCISDKRFLLKNNYFVKKLIKLSKKG